MRRLHWATWLGVAMIVLPVLSLTPYMLSGTEAVRARNALLLDESADAGIDWLGSTMPKGFLVDRGPADPMFVSVARRLRLAALPTDWDRALAISRHLLDSSPTLVGGSIDADLRSTYRSITRTGKGDCDDFVRIFGAIATAAGMPVRTWAFSFDGFGGHGHVVAEIWNRQVGALQLLDVSDNAYFTSSGPPLSALALRSAMLSARSDLRVHRLDPLARPGYIDQQKDWAYYRRGLPEWYLFWGINPFDQAQAWSVRMLAPVSHSLAQLGAIVQGVHPHIHVLVTDGNRAQIDALQRLRLRLLGAFASAIFGSIIVGASMLPRFTVRRRSLAREGAGA